MKHIVTGKEISQDPTKVRQTLATIDVAKHLSSFKSINVELSSKKIEDNLPLDLSLTYALSALDSINENTNVMRQRLKTLLSIAWPKEMRTSDDESLVSLKLAKKHESLARPLTKTEQTLASSLQNLLAQFLKSKEECTKSAESLVTTIAPNCATLLGPLLAARMIAGAGSLQKLALMPASTIQMLGARKAVLRHLTTGAKNPKYGLLFQHSFVRHAKHPGRHARVLADKLAICARVDLFKGKPIAKKILKEIQSND